MHFVAFKNLIASGNASTTSTDPSSPASMFAGRNITVSAASQFKSSLVRLYYNALQQRVYPYFTAIFDVKKGVVDRVTWDDACVFCGGLGKCVETTYDFNGQPQTQSSAKQSTKSCFLTLDACTALLAKDPTSTACDLTLYVVWTGTDGNGQALQSHAYRFSTFPPQELADRVTQLLPDLTGSRPAPPPAPAPMAPTAPTATRRELTESRESSSVSSWSETVIPESWRQWWGAGAGLGNAYN
jgi:hypothetical protein